MSTTLEHPPPTAPAPQHAGRPVLIGISATLLVALAAGIVLALTRSTSYSEGSPERAAQGYLQALMDDDADLARSYLAPELAAQCAPDEPYSWWVRSAESIRFSDVRTVDGRVAIDLDLSRLDPIDPFGFPFEEPYDPFRDAELILEDHDGTWLITEAVWPLHECTQR